MIQPQNLSYKTICRRNDSFGSVSFQKIGKTYFRVRDVNEAELCNCICGHCRMCHYSRLIRPT